MDKIFNNISIVGSIIGGVLLKVLGGYDSLLITLVVLIGIDYITGFCKGVITKQLSSGVSFMGISKKVMVFCVVALSVSLQNIIGDSIPLREVVVMFYISNEGLSVLENVGEFLPLPSKLKDILIQIRDK